MSFNVWQDTTRRQTMLFFGTI